MSRVKAYTATAIGVFAVWWAAPLVRLAAAPPPVAAWWRFTIGGAAITLIAAARRSRLPLEPRAVAAGLLLYLHMLLWFYSLEGATILASTALVTTYPVFIAAVEAFRGEVPRWKAVLVAAPLIAATIYTSTGISSTAALEALLSSLSVSGYFLVLRAARLRGFDADGLAAVTYASAAAISTLHLTLLHINPLGVSPHSVPYLVALGLIPMALGHTLLNYALAYLPATIVTGAVLTEPLGASLLAALLLGETPPAAQVSLSLSLLASTAAALYPQTSRSRRARSSSRAAQHTSR